MDGKATWDGDAAWRRLMREVFPKKGGKKLRRIIDVQCGSGDLWRIAQKRFKQYVGVDSDAERIARAQRKWRRGMFHQADPSALDYPAGYFDVAHSWGWVSTLTPEELASPLKELFRVSGGYIIFNLPVLAAPADRLEVIRHGGETFRTPMSLHDEVQAANPGAEMKASWTYGLFAEVEGRTYSRNILVYRKGMENAPGYPRQDHG